MQLFGLMLLFFAKSQFETNMLCFPFDRLHTEGALIVRGLMQPVVVIFISSRV